MGNDNKLTNLVVFPQSDQAACQDAPREVFFPPGNAGRQSYARARRICFTCPVRLACLEWELSQETPHMARAGMGMFGGKTPRERSAILKQRKGTQ